MILLDLPKVWKRLLCLTVILFIVGIIFVPDELDYYCGKAKRAIEKGDYSTALEVGKKSYHTNDELTTLRAYALYKQGKLADCLFEYPLSGRSASLKMLPADDKDRVLCADLMDKNLDLFARHLMRYYSVESEHLPKHYREALILLSHLRSNPIIVYRSNVLEADYVDYQRMEKTAPQPEARKNVLRNVYGSTYWYYYDYGE